MTPSGYKPSRYVEVSESDYVTGDNPARLKLVYSTRTATPVVLPSVLGCRLSQGTVPDIGTGLFERLVAAQILVPAGQDERATVLSRNRAAAAGRKAASFILMPTSYCNMGCEYCGQVHRRGGMTPEHRDQVRARVLDAVRTRGIRELNIEWFGAEPMMGYAALRDLASSFIAAADRAGVDYRSAMVTNGSLLRRRNLDELIHRYRVSRFFITLDGTAEVHDRHRPLKSGQGSFWRILDAVNYVATDASKRHVHIELRTNVDADNEDRIDAYIDFMADHGLRRGEGGTIELKLTRVRPWGNDVSAVELDNATYADRELKWLRAMHARGLSTMILPTVAKTVTCPAVDMGAELIDGDGRVYTCTDHPLVPGDEDRGALGTVVQLGMPTRRPAGEFDDWHERIERDEVGCARCRFLPTCGGSCPKAWSEGNLPCPGYKFNFQGRLDLLATRLGLEVAAG